MWHILSVLMALAICAMPACSFTSMVGSIPIFGLIITRSIECTEYKQAETNAEFVIAAAKQLELRGVITNTKLMEIDQDAGLYSARMKQLCEFFSANKITYSEYQEGVAKAHADYTKLRVVVLEHQQKLQN